MKQTRLGRGDPEKRRGFLRRGQESGARALRASAREATLDRSKPLRSKRKPRPPEGPLTRVEWERQVYALDRGRDVVTGELVLNPRPVNFHHVVPKQLLRRDGRHDIVFDPDNGVTVTEATHAGHEAAQPRIPRDKLPARCLAFAEREGCGWYIEKTYPAASGGQDDDLRRS